MKFHSSFLTVASVLILILSLFLLVTCREGDKASGGGTQGEQVLFAKGDPEGVACYRIPSLVTAPNGDLIAAVDERVPSCGDLKWSRDINIVVRRSKDNGKTWTPIERVADLPDGQSASDPSMIVDNKTGDILLFYNYMDHDSAPGIYRHHMMRSSDNGKTWSNPVDITPQITKPEWHSDFMFITSGRGLQLKSGRLLNTLVNIDKGVHLFGSDDHGVTWFLIDSPVKPADESIVTELRDGSLMVNSRVNGAGIRYVHTSADGGITWNTMADSSLSDPGCNAGLLRYSVPGKKGTNDVLLFINANSTLSRENLTLRVSDDDGKTWSQDKIIHPGSAAYSAITVLKNGRIGILFEKDNYGEIVFVSEDAALPGGRRP